MNSDVNLGINSEMIGFNKKSPLTDCLDFFWFLLLFLKVFCVQFLAKEFRTSWKMWESCWETPLTSKHQRSRPKSKLINQWPGNPIIQLRLVVFLTIHHRFDFASFPWFFLLDFLQRQIGRYNQMIATESTTWAPKRQLRKGNPLYFSEI